jgi:hypothetical protein
MSLHWRSLAGRLFQAKSLADFESFAKARDREFGFLRIEE